MNIGIKKTEIKTSDTNGNKIRRHYVVRGRVQGVGFRYTAYYTARAYGITGYAKNCYDGSVELELQGNPDTVNKFFSLMDTRRYISIEDIEERDMQVDPDERHFKTY